MNFDWQKLIMVVLVAGMLFWVASMFVDFNDWSVKTINDDGMAKIVVVVIVLLGVSLAMRMVSAQSLSRKSLLMIILAVVGLYFVAKYLIPAIGTGSIPIFQALASLP